LGVASGPRLQASVLYKHLGPPSPASGKAHDQRSHAFHIIRWDWLGALFELGTRRIFTPAQDDVLNNGGRGVVLGTHGCDFLFCPWAAFALSFL
jgi:hypothetical protein